MDFIRLLGLLARYFQQEPFLSLSDKNKKEASTIFFRGGDLKRGKGNTGRFTRQ